MTQIRIELKSPSNLKTYTVIKHDDEAQDDRMRIGMPEVFPLYLAKYCDLTSAAQWLWFRAGLVHPYTGFKHYDEKLLSKAIVDMLKGKWRSLTKASEAFTNFKGTNTNKDYVSPNTLSGLPGQEPLASCGNIVGVLGEPIRLGGEYKTPIKTLIGDVAYDIAKVNRLLTPEVVMCATNVAADKSEGGGNWKPIYTPSGRHRVDPFPQLQAFGKDTLFLLRTKRSDAIDLERKFQSLGIKSPAGIFTENGIPYAVNYIRASRLKQVQSESIPTPYVLL